jgi:type I restriction enzyme S subunit
MSLNFKYIPLTFLNDLEQIKEQVKNTIILSHFFDKNKDEVKLEKLIEGTQYGYNASALEAGQNKFLRISDITDGIVNWDSVPYCDCTDEKTYLLQKDDLLIARTGGTTGKSFLIDNPPSKAIYAGYLIRIRSNEKSIPDFLNLFLNSYAYWSQVLSLNKGEFRPSVNATKLKELILPKCNIQEQKDAIRISKGEKVKGYENLAKRIQETLISFDKSQEVLNEYNSQKHLLTQLKQSILQEAIQGKLTADWRANVTLSGAEVEPASELLKRIKAEKAQLVKDKKIKKEKPLPTITKEEIPFELPEWWVWCRLGDIIVNSDNLNIHNVLPPNELVNYVDIDTIDNKLQIIKEPKLLPVNQLSSRARRVLKKGSIMYSLVRPYLHNLAMIEDDKKNYIGSTGFAVFDCLEIENKYVFWLLLSKYIEDLYLDFMDGFNSPSITHDQFKNTIIPVPPLSEQKEIVKKVEALILHYKELEQEIQTSEANAQMLMQAVLKEAFEGGTKKGIVWQD